jgi:hypothetical protein
VVQQSLKHGGTPVQPDNSRPDNRVPRPVRRRRRTAYGRGLTHFIRLEVVTLTQRPRCDLRQSRRRRYEPLRELSTIIPARNSIPGLLDRVHAFHSFLAEFVMPPESVRLKQVSATAEKVDHLPWQSEAYSPAVLAVNARSCRESRGLPGEGPFGVISIARAVKEGPAPRRLSSRRIA